MDLKLVREEAIEATARFFAQEGGLVPDEDGEEWEAEYRRQFELVKARHAAGGAASGQAPPSAATAPASAPDPGNWAELSGAPTQVRWAATLRADRIREIRDPGVRDWLGTTWTKAKGWIDTRELPTPVFLERIAPHYREYRKKADEEARLRAQERRERNAAGDELRRQVERAGITVAGLIELVDICDRLPAVPLGKKLAELDDEHRNLRIFETDDPAFLMVLEKDRSSREEYAIERDEGLVADLDLWVRAMALS